MPVLKQLSCRVESNGEPIQEFGATYGDGLVQSYIIVPTKPASFSIRLRSNDFIASGLAMFVYIDGTYQCNRNRQGLKTLEEAEERRDTSINFRVERKEQYLLSGAWLTQNWRFEELDIGMCRQAGFDLVNCYGADCYIQYPQIHRASRLQPGRSSITWEILKSLFYAARKALQLLHSNHLHFRPSKETRIVNQYRRKNQINPILKSFKSFKVKPRHQRNRGKQLERP
jgi:hypothetical protein